MKKNAVFLSVLTLCGMSMTACGTSDTTAQTQDIAAAMIEEQTPAKSENQPDPEVLSVLPESAVYNPDLGEYYDSDLMTWNPDTKSYDYIQRDPASIPQTMNVEAAYELVPYTGTVPEELEEAFLAAEETIEPLSNFDSSFPCPTPEASRMVAECCTRYFADTFEIAVTYGDYFAYAQNAVQSILDINALFYQSVKGGYFYDRTHQHYEDAAEAILALGKNITADDCTALQEEYGYLIAPALEDLGKLDLLQIDPDAPCTDPEQLAEFARYFA